MFLTDSFVWNILHLDPHKHAMPRRSFLDCPHTNVQQFTEVCLDCYCNIYMTKEEYLAELEKEAERKGIDDATREIRALEKRLGITPL